jgi:hypothetical protein
MLQPLMRTSGHGLRGAAVLGAAVLGAAVEGAGAVHPDVGQILAVPEQPPEQVYVLNKVQVLSDKAHLPELQVPRPLHANGHVLD